MSSFARRRPRASTNRGSPSTRRRRSRWSCSSRRRRTRMTTKSSPRGHRSPPPPSVVVLLAQSADRTQIATVAAKTANPRTHRPTEVRSIVLALISKFILPNGSPTTTVAMRPSVGSRRKHAVRRARSRVRHGANKPSPLEGAREQAGNGPRCCTATTAPGRFRRDATTRCEEAASTACAPASARRRRRPRAPRSPSVGTAASRGRAERRSYSRSR